jgi:outer membrane immunogenic protein
MKSFLLAAGALAVLGAAAPAFAQPFGPMTGYGTLGAADFNDNDANVPAITGRLGARFGPFFGVEGELSGGLGSSGANVGGTHVSASLRDQYAGYAVGYIPVMPNADLFGRIGYGAQDIHVEGSGVNNTFNETSWNMGGGGQYFFDGKNGVRAEYTRFNTADSDLDANVWSLAYVRRF